MWAFANRLHDFSECAESNSLSAFLSSSSTIPLCFLSYPRGIPHSISTLTHQGSNSINSPSSSPSFRHPPASKYDYLHLITFAERPIYIGNPI
ncbi:hypothetical protein PtA15_11A105 [Puccinia triticina]|uniref:Uncharacterized protein n=1 Tax=Puccinia triticina TaxID=208348 RepID=A0ABY7CZI4_9BASI|nr:uncharacterized protein PtA15_11A105 [Puccinia triticina]WAQ89417.1 hypothetical protein PtA15_11A105 [Puccinia triticina]